MGDFVKLYLSSLGIPDKKAYRRLFDKQQTRVAIVPTAWNVASAEKSRPFIGRSTQEFAELQFETGVVDLAKFGGKKDELAATLANFDGVWITGGNCFYLNYWMRESGFDALLPSLSAAGFVYGGESAGAVVAGKTLHGIEVLDNPAEAPETLWPGLGMVDYGILPHWGKPKHADRYQIAYEEMRLFAHVKTLSDDQFISIKELYL